MLSKVCLLVVTFCLAPGFSENSAREIDARITPSTSTSILEFPHQVAVLYFGSHHCGGAIISENWVLTGGECVADVPTAARYFLSMRIGSTNRNTGGEIYRLADYVIHDDFDQDTLDYDFALLKVDKPLEFRQNVQPILLPYQDQEIQYNTIFNVTGWGRMGNVGLYPTVLQRAETPSVTQEFCEELHADNNIVLTDRMLCAGLLNGASFCVGDLGAPLVHGGVLYGIASWSTGCGQIGNPGVYAKVASVRNWINEITGV